MARLILKSPFLKGGKNAGGHVRYIATRDRVELVPDGRPATQKQAQLIASLTKDFPDVKKLPEYGSYQDSPTKVNASVFITQALEDNWPDVQQSDIYAEYIATRPRVERVGSHGLFGDEDYVDLKKVTAELQNCEKNVWTHIISLKREDAARLGYDNARTWRNLLLTHRNDIAAAMNIPPNEFRWYAAFHDEGDHPHVHMMAWSAGDAPGYLSPAGIQKIKSMLTNDIFRQEMLHVYEQKGQSRDELVAETHRAMLELADEMKQGVCEHPEAEQMLLSLSRELKNAKGKKQYGYLSKSVKKQVDDIVDQMARLPSVKECYEKWLELQQEVNEFDSDKPMERVPLSQQKGFRAIHNAVIQAALRLGHLTFEDRDMAQYDEPDDILQSSETCKRIWSVICDDSLPLNLRDEWVDRLRTQAEDGNHYAQLILGRLYRDGPLVTPDWLEARYWFEQAARELPDAQYALGKLLLADDVEVHDREQGIRWLTRAAVDFGVTYDASTNSVHIDSTQPYQEEASAVPSAPTEASVQAALARLRETYPTGTEFPTPYRSTSGGPYHRGTHCSGWAMLCSDAAFGNLPWRRVDNPSWEQTRSGDLIRYDNSASGHVVVVIGKTDEYIKVTESGLNSHARWGGQYFKWWLEERPGYTLYTRYPE